MRLLWGYRYVVFLVRGFLEAKGWGRGERERGRLRDLKTRKVWVQLLINWVLQFLFLEPNASDPLNKEAAEDLRSNREGFKRNVRTSMSGGAVKAQQYERVISR